ncbi:glycosyltransferase family 39 protein [Accumulibacter sp.]|uniref:glycosyltransferase family 39 protein n=1 Tax=Accumulibacter sp. TaxID=2053492 RepID=UPI0025D8AAE1|nr:glycosyltransferase family 39 protein [Accumulibacter sp.]MCM8625776.1 glycosyltransferase family 39 protein [Accumulibacter sp.]
MGVPGALLGVDRRWLVAGVVSAAVDSTTFGILQFVVGSLELSQAVAFALSLLAGLIVLRGVPFPRPRLLMLLAVVLAYPLRAGVLSLTGPHLPAALAIVPGALLGSLGLVLAVATMSDGRGAVVWTRAAVLAIAYLLVLRLVFIGQINLLPQEAYYWNYSRHLDIGYLDHPPMVAWLIAASLALGKSEFLVRLPAVICWAVMLGFAVALARDVAGRTSVPATALLAATLPYFFIVGVFVTPDSPLAAAWAAALYGLHRALFSGSQRAWIGAGAAIGIGMLSKYSMVLVPAAAFVFILVDPQSRPLLRSRWPWCGVLVALLAFSPVIIWNLQHDWASFSFQGSRRLAERTVEFSLPEFLAYVLLLLTPLGVLAFWRLLHPVATQAADGPGRGRGAPVAAIDARERRFLLSMTIIPLSVFAVASLRAETKFHWTGPIWLALLPVLAATTALPGLAAQALDRLLIRCWPPLLGVLIVVYAYGFFYYPVWGVAGVRVLNHYLKVDWRELRAQVLAIEEAVFQETGRHPAVVGLDRHNTADELAYYDPRGDGSRDTASRHLFFDDNAVMYEFWFSREAFAGQDLIAVSPRREDVEDPRVVAAATRLGPVQVLTAKRGGVVVGTYYARVVYGYRLPEQRP